jgi:alpha-N-arabinofuranosidase
MTLEVELRGLGAKTIASATELHHADLKATNTKAAPDTVKPSDHARASLEAAVLKATLKPLSWNVFALGR